jgi:osmotically-inducible protein OsmY
MNMKGLALASVIFFGANTLLIAYLAPPYNTPYNSRPGSYTGTQLPNQTEVDKEISKEVEERIRDDYYLAPYADNVQIYSLAGRVTLTGRLNSDTVRLRMAEKANGIRGVQSVSNNIEVDKTR